MSLATNRLLWRNLTGELDTTVVPDSSSGSLIGVDDYCQRGAEALNDIAGYFWKDSTISLTAGAESTLPTDLIEVVFVTLGDVLLKPTDMEQLNADEPHWRREPAGMPREYFVYSKLGFYPKLDDTAAALTCTMRHIATPTTSSTPGFDLLASQHQRIPIYYGAALWFEAHGLDGDAFRADRFMRMFEREAELVKDYYARRRIQRGPVNVRS